MSLQWDRDYAHRKPSAKGFASVLYFYAGCAVIFGAVCGLVWIGKVIGEWWAK